LIRLLKHSAKSMATTNN